MDDGNFQALVNTTDNFKLRRAVERLREGLFDPLGVRLLTTGETRLAAAFDRGVKGLEKKVSSHLCVCGGYGQGKSHSLNYIRDQALDRNFVVSYVNLDPRQVPFHNFKEVFQALIKAIEFPGSGGNGEKAKRGETSFVSVWKKGAQEWLARPENSKKEISDLVPKKIPHRFRAVLTALAQDNITIAPKKRGLKKHAGFKPREFSWILKSALMGKNIPLGRLASVLNYRQVSFYRDHSLVCRGEKSYLDLVQGLADLFERIGFKGWLVLFDEGESIVQNRITARSKSYDMLDRIFRPKTFSRGFYPVFAFTPDFFAALEDEPYDRVKVKKKGVNGNEPLIPYFKQNYSRAWEGIEIHSLQDLGSNQWKELTHKLVRLHGAAYGWKPDVDAMEEEMGKKVSKLTGVEARLKLKFLVNHLDIEQQQQVLACSPRVE